MSNFYFHISVDLLMWTLVMWSSAFSIYNKRKKKHDSFLENVSPKWCWTKIHHETLLCIFFLVVVDPLRFTTMARRSRSTCTLPTNRRRTWRSWSWPSINWQRSNSSRRALSNAKSINTKPREYPVTLLVQIFLLLLICLFLFLFFFTLFVSSMSSFISFLSLSLLPIFPFSLFLFSNPVY